MANSGYSGIVGYSGLSGYSGIWGYSGYSGVEGGTGTGVSGYSGRSGYSGIFGFEGTSGFSGMSGFSSYSGHEGYSGLSGYSGVWGYSGYSGVEGSYSASGYSGMRGGTGTSGYSGRSGIGYSGYSGIGSPGASGYSGAVGYSGHTGIDGVSGYSGIIGTFHGDASNINLGHPAFGDWSTGIGGFTDTTKVTDSIHTLDDIVELISPAKPGVFTGNDLSYSGTSKYTVKLSSGLSAHWYTDGLVPGQTITDYILDNSYRLTSPNLSTCFYCGFYNDPQGILQLYQDGTAIDSYDVSLGTGSSILLTLNDLSTYNNIWKKGNAYANLIQASEGLVQYYFKHTLSGQTNIASFRYDNSNLAAVFYSGPTITVNSIVSKYLSGVTYYGRGTILNVSFVANNLFNKCYNATQLGIITMYPAAASAYTIVSPTTPGNYTDQLNIVNQPMTLSNQNFASNSAFIRVTIFKANGVSIYSDVSLALRVCTYGNVATDTIEYFYDESYRLLMNTGAYWNSLFALSNGNAQVRNGVLMYPDPGDYPGFTNDQSYQRWFYKTSASTGTIVFSGINYTDIDPQGTGSLNILLTLDGDGVTFDLGKPVGDGNGCRVSGSGGSIIFSFGTYSTANNNNRYRITIVFKDRTHAITYVVTS